MPSFYELLLSLGAGEEPREFTVVLRGPRDDVSEAATELNAFCEGKHPNYPLARMEDHRVQAPHTTGETSYSHESGPQLVYVAPHTGFVTVGRGSRECCGGWEALLQSSCHTLALREGVGEPRWLAVDGSLHEDAPHHILFLPEDDQAALRIEDSATGKALGTDEATGQWLLRVDPIASMDDKAYYIAAINACEAKLGISRAMQL